MGSDDYKERAAPLLDELRRLRRAVRANNAMIRSLLDSAIGAIEANDLSRLQDDINALGDWMERGVQKAYLGDALERLQQFCEEFGDGGAD